MRTAIRKREVALLLRWRKNCWQWIARRCIWNCLPEEFRQALLEVLAHDPRPAYQEDSERVYGMEFAGVNVRFRVQNGTLIVCGAEKKRTVSS